MTNWPVKTLGELFEFKNGRCFKKTEWSSSGLPIIRIQNLNSDSAPYNYFQGTYDQNILVETGDLLFSWSGSIGTSFGPHVWRRSPGLLNQHIFKVCPKVQIDTDYAHYCLRAITAEIERSVNGAVGLVHITKEKLNKFEIPVPPMEEQKRIVELLDAATARVTELTACYEQARTHANNLYTSALRDALESNPDWPVRTLGEICEVVNGATPDTKVKEYWGGSHAWITPAEMGGLDSPYLSSSRRTLTDEGLASCSATLLPPRTVILSSRAPIGHLVINKIPMATNQGCKSLKPNAGLDHKFLYFFLKANVELLESLGTGTTFKELSGTQLKTVKMPVPPLEEQKRIVELLDSMRAKTSEMVAAYDAKLTAAKNLRQSILEAAFAGDL